MPERTCPECGNELVFKHGIYGQFIGCSNYPICSFTMNEDGTPTRRKREVEEWDEDGNPTSYVYAPIIKGKIVKKCPYNKCDGSGLLPFIGKDGKTRNDAHIFCDCHDEYANAYPHQLKPSDFDYSMSYSHYRSLCREHGWQDPGSDYPDELVREPEPPREIIHRFSDLSKQEFALLQEHDRALKYLMSKQKQKKSRRGIY